MGNNNEYKPTNRNAENLQNDQNQSIKTRCLCNSLKYDDKFPHRDLPPPAPPDGRDDLWELQFCRWWGWNWVRRQETGTKPLTRYDEGKKTSGCTSSRRRKEKTAVQAEGRRFLDPQVKRPEGAATCPQIYTQSVNRQMGPKPKVRMQPTSSIPTKQQLKEMCQCLLGKRPETCGMANLYNTPSASVVAMERLSCGVTDKTVMHMSQRPICLSPNCKKKSRREKIFEDGCKVQSWSKRSEDSGLTESDEMISPLCTQKNASSTEESIEYLSIRLQHIKSDTCCPCHKHLPPAKQNPPIKYELQTQTSFCATKDHKETQTCQQKVKTCWRPSQNALCGEQVLKLRGKKHKTICICVCCCASCKPTNPEKSESNGESKTIESEIKSTEFSEEQNINPDEKKKTDECCDKAKDNVTNDSGADKNRSTEDSIVTYPFAVPPTNMKMLSKFGTPSKNYPWMQSTGSDVTTTTLNNIATYKSPATGKTYDLATLNFDSHENLTLPDLIDITEDLSYLKTLENTSKCDSESRLLLDAVCDAILQEHQENSSDCLKEFEIDDDVTRALEREYKDLGISCNLTEKFSRKIDAYTKLSKEVLNPSEEIDIQLKKTSYAGNILNDPSIKLSNIDSMIGKIMDNIFTESDVDVRNNNVLKTSNSGARVVDSVATAKAAPPFKFKGTDHNVFTKTGLLAFKPSSIYKKSTKRGASNWIKDNNSNKKLKHQNPEKTKDETSKTICQTNERFGNIFNKIESIVKKSKVKSAEIQKVLCFAPSTEEHGYEASENISKAYSLSNTASKSCSRLDLTSKTSVETASSRRSYPMSSDSFKGQICDTSEQISGSKAPKKSYEAFGDKFDYSLNDYTKSCCGIASETIVEEENINSGEDNDKSKDLGSKNSDTASEKNSKLSIQNFTICDEKATLKLFSGGTGSKTEKKILKKKKSSGSCASLIPIRKQSSSAGSIRKKM